MALLKWKKGVNEWLTFYVDAIRNRLRRDLNLSDLTDILTARKNLEIYGDSNKTHFHDDRYIPLINSAKQANEDAVNNLSVTLSGNVTSAPSTRDSSNNIIVPVTSVTADKSILEQTAVTTAMHILLAAGDSTQKLRFNPNFNYTPSTNTLAIGKIQAGSIIADSVVGAVWNDYAEFFPRGEETEPGDIVMLNVNSDKEEYSKAVEGATCVAGIHSDEFAHLIGGEKPPADEDFVEYNMKKFIPVGLAGRVKVNFVGKAEKGVRVVPSNIPGYGRLYDAGKDSVQSIVGYLVESDNLTGKRKLKVKLLNS
jgi:hypothetical protein